MTASELREALDALPKEDARMVSVIVETAETLARTDAAIVEAIELLQQLDERQDQRIAVLERTCAVLVSHLGLDGEGSALAAQLLREVERAGEPEPEHALAISTVDRWLWKAHCSCGWDAPLRDNRHNAAFDANDHAARYGAGPVV